MRKRADLLVPAMRVAALGVHKPAVELLPELREIPLERWSLILAIGWVSIATRSLQASGLSVPFRDELGVRFSVELSAWDESWLPYFKDCIQFVQTGLASDDSAIEADLVGSWMVMNALERATLSDEHLPLVALLGRGAGREFHFWWE